MTSRPPRISAVVVAIAAALVISGCSGTPAAPGTDTPSADATATAEATPGPYLGFGTEAEAIAAAEEVYTAYVAATSASWSGDEAADPFSFVMSPLYDIELEAAALIEERGLVLEGTTQSEVIESSVIDGREVRLIACQTVSGRVLDANGNDVTPANRAAVQTVDVRVLRDADGELRISRSDLFPESQC